MLLLTSRAAGQRSLGGKLSKNHNSGCMQGLSWPLAKEGYSMDCELGGFQSPPQRTSPGSTGSFSQFGNGGVGCPGPCVAPCTVPSASVAPWSRALCLRFSLLDSSVPAVLRFLHFALQPCVKKSQLLGSSAERLLLYQIFT